MSLNDIERHTLVQLELDKAHEAFEDIEVLASAGRWSGAANRMYYAVFHAVNALLIHDSHPVNTHRGSHAIFSMYYIKTGVLPAECGRLYNNLQTLREESDYNCVFNATEADIKEGIEPARKLISSIESLINEHKQ
ncbi:MAG: HEPN domain-containing protein [Bacteroidaceae bacterium]|nr:HEPN domain-containing protein [Bacteroidaceae bacterium]